jgi:hypothetical protein
MSSVAFMIDTVASVFGVDSEQVLSGSRQPAAVAARHVAGHLIGQRCALSSVKVGEALGIDHTTVLFGNRKVAERLKDDPEFRVLVRAIEQTLDANERWQALVKAEDLLAIASKAARHRRAAVGLTVGQIMAVSEGFLALWELARAGERLAQMIVDGDGDAAALAAIAASMIEGMDALRGEEAQATGEEA